MWADIVSTCGILLIAGLTAIYILQLTEQLSEDVPAWKFGEVEPLSDGTIVILKISRLKI